MKADPEIAAAVQRNFEPCWQLADWLTAHPETGGSEEQAAKRITALLRERGYRITAPAGSMPHSFRAEDGRPDDRNKPSVALLCEYDALPVVGHGCGHSISGMISVLAALALREAFPRLPFRLDVVGTPNEEAFGGKVVMAREGIFDRDQFAIMGHLDNINCPQIKVVACDGIYIVFHGVATHAASSPELGVNALNAAQFFMHATDLLRQHLPQDCQIHGIVAYGGDVPNTTPDRVELDYYYRAATMAHMADLREKLLNCIRGAALATGCTYTLKANHSELFAELSYLPTAVRAACETFDALGMPWQEMAKAEGSTDAGNVDLVTPTFHLELAATDVFCGFHTREFEAQMHGERGRRTLRDGALVLANLIKRLADDPRELAQIRQEHAAYRAANPAGTRAQRAEDGAVRG